MVIKVYISGISASKDIKKRQQRAQMILDSLKIGYETVDITEPEKEEERKFMKENCKKRNDVGPLPPQFFSDTDYLGDFEDFELANDDDRLLSFLKLEDRRISMGEASSGDVDGVTNGTGSRGASEPPEEKTDAPKAEEAGDGEEGEENLANNSNNTTEPTTKPDAENGEEVEDN